MYEHHDDPSSSHQNAHGDSTPENYHYIPLSHAHSEPPHRYAEDDHDMDPRQAIMQLRSAFHPAGHSQFRFEEQESGTKINCQRHLDFMEIDM